jgi:hypothetical protein
MRGSGYRATVVLAAAIAAFLSAAEQAKAQAADGVLEIDAACVSQGCFPGDTPGWPVQIASRGSYRLTSNLTLYSRAVSAIWISSDRVTLDLNGFGIEYCPGGSFCQIGASAAGIFGSTRRGVVVRDGSITGAGEQCVALGPEALVEDLYARRCNVGVYVGEGSRVQRVAAEGNRAFGLEVGAGSIVSQSSVSGGRVGISFHKGVLVLDSSIRKTSECALCNRSSGAWTKGGYRGCLITENGANEEVQVISGGLVDLGGNLCGTDTVCP